MKYLKVAGDSILPLFDGVVYGQTMSLCEGVLEIRFATYQRVNTSETVLTIYDKAGVRIFQTCISNRLLNDCEVFRFQLPENLECFGDRFIVTLHSNGSVANNTVGVFVKSSDLKMLWESNANRFPQCVLGVRQEKMNSSGAMLDAKNISFSVSQIGELYRNEESLAVNINPQSFLDRDVAADAAYALKIAENYIDELAKANANVLGMRILEIGPGVNFGTSLILKCMGASKVFVSDRFLAEFVHGYHDVLYLELAKMLKAKYPDSDVRFLENCAASGYSENIIEFSDLPLELLDQLGLSFDIILSNAVFEHLYDPMLAIKSLKTLSAPGAIGIHQVDFRDHRNFERPLEFLLLDQHSFSKLFEEQHGECGNRVRHQHLSKMFKKAGFSEVVYASNMEADAGYAAQIRKLLADSPLVGAMEFSQLDLISVSGLFCTKN